MPTDITENNKKIPRRTTRIYDSISLKLKKKKRKNYNKKNDLKELLVQGNESGE